MDILMEWIRQFIDIILNMDLYLNNWIRDFGPMIYVLVFMVIFCETGLVVTPFLPGDSFLFALGAMAAVENAYLSLPMLLFLLSVAAILGCRELFRRQIYWAAHLFEGHGIVPQ
jgi:membrane-associated protein